MTIRFRQPATLIFALLATLAVLSVCGSGTSQLVPLDQRDGSVLDGSEARLVLNQCSHYAPSEATATWRPDSSQLAEIERRLPEFIQGQADRPPGDFREYYRQYVGVVVDGHQLIYINGFPKDSVAENVAVFERFKREHPSVNLTSKDFPDSMRTIDGWRHAAVVVCDGGAAYWGVIYEPATRRFTSYSPNGIG